MMSNYDDWVNSLVRDPEIMGGSTVFPGTRVTVQRIAGLIKNGEATSVILEDYPFLMEQDLEFVSRYIHNRSLRQSLVDRGISPAENTSYTDLLTGKRLGE